MIDTISCKMAADIYTKAFQDADKWRVGTWLINVVDPKIASQEAKAAFRANPVSASLSGLGPRMVGVGFKRVPKFGILLAFSFVVDDGDIPGVISATGAS